jgi:hypothetical protein
MSQPMQPHQQRMLEEAAQLKDRLDKLTGFIRDNELFHSLPEREQKRMRMQCAAMEIYFLVLSERIDALSIATSIQA